MFKYGINHDERKENVEKLRYYKELKIIVFFIIFLILLIFVSLIIIIKNNNKKEDEDITMKRKVLENIENKTIEKNSIKEIEIYEEEEIPDYMFNQKVDVTNEKYFYTVQECIKTYLNNIYDLSKVKSKFEDVWLKKIYNELSENYIKKNNINLKNLKEFLDLENPYSNVTVVGLLEYQKKENENIERILRYAVHTVCIQNKEIEYLNFIVYLDYENLTFAIEPIDNTIMDLNTVDLSENLSEIKKNGDNEYNLMQISRKEVLDKYISYFNRLVKDFPEIAFEYLDEKEKNQIGSIEDFKKYINSNKQRFKNIQISKFNMEGENGTEIYSCYDSNGYLYKIKEKAIMQFKISILN